jgi:predicted type IV restriction endonuclease
VVIPKKEEYMAEKISEVINDLKSNKDRIYEYDEAKTKQAIIMRILSSLNWNTFDVEEVYPEYSIGNGRVDYSLRIGNANKVFLEAKKAGEELEKESHQEQLLSYSFQQGIKLAILTNGLIWWFYLPLTEGSWEQRKFYSIDVLQQENENIVTKFSDFLLKTNIASGKANENAELVHIDQQKQKVLLKTIPEAWNKIVSEPNDLLVELVNEITEGICGFKAENDMIEQFLLEHKEYFIIKHDNLLQTKKKLPKTLKLLPQNLLPISGNYRSKKILAFYFLKSRYEVDSWKGLLIKLCDIINQRHTNEFNKVFQLKGKKRTYFTNDAKELRKSEKINDTNVFVETNQSAFSVTQLCQQIIALFGYSDNDLLIELMPEQT